MSTKLRALILTVIATIILALAATGFSSAIGQRMRNGNLQITQLTSVVITGADIRNLPSGENRLVISGGGDPTAATPPTGSVVFTVDGTSRSIPLTKTGRGTLMLPSASSFGVTKVGPGTLANTPTHSSGGITKLGSRLLIIQSDSSYVVLEFRDLGLAEADSIFFRAGERLEKLKTAVQQTRPQAAMKGWPFQRLLIGLPNGIAQVEGWTAGSKPPVSKYVCSGGSCACSGTSDCLNLASSCTSDMDCDGAGASIKCYCKSK